MQTTLSNFVIITATSLAFGQEGPNPLYDIPIYDTSQVFRQNICYRERMVQNGTIAFENALQGIDLRVFLLNDNTYMMLDEQNNINEAYPGIAIEIMDEVCRLAGCSWRNNFTTQNLETIPSDVDFTELFNWTTKTYDITVSLVSDLIQRRELGITFPENWFKSDIIMIAKKNEQTGSNNHFWQILFAWSNPFSIGVWLLIMFTIFSSGFIYWLMEKLDPETDDINYQKKANNPGRHTFFAAQTFVGHFEFKPRTRAARLFSFSMSFWALIIGASYTANLASFLIWRNPETTSVNNLEEAIYRDFRLCTTKGFSSETIVMRDFPQATFIQKESEFETYEGVRKEICDVAITERDSWRSHEKNSEFNGECNLEWVGREYIDLSSGFATRSDSGILCTSLLTEVFNLHIRRMKENGFIEAAWQRHLERHQNSQDCQLQGVYEASDDTENETLNLNDTVGVFITHYILVSISFLMVIAKRYRKLWLPQKPRTADDVSKESAEKDGVKTYIINSLRAQQDAIMEQNRSLTIQYEKLTKILENNMQKDKAFPFGRSEELSDSFEV